MANEKEGENFTRTRTRRSTAFFARLPGCPAILRNAVWCLSWVMDSRPRILPSYLCLPFRPYLPSLPFFVSLSLSLSLADGWRGRMTRKVGDLFVNRRCTECWRGRRENEKRKSQQSWWGSMWKGTRQRIHPRCIQQIHVYIGEGKKGKRQSGGEDRQGAAGGGGGGGDGEAVS